MTTASHPTLVPAVDRPGWEAAIDQIGQLIHRQTLELREAHGENLGLRALLAVHGIEAEAPPGVITLRRMRALENVLDLARMHLRNPTPDTEAALRQATDLAGRAP